jgi:hypothetical protein
MGNPHSKNFGRLQKETSSGNITANDIMNHVTDIDLGFGGVGQSGYGRVGGYEAFKQWSNSKSIVQKYQINLWPITDVCPPYTNGKKKLLRILMSTMFIKQNKFLGFIGKVILVVLAYMILLGQLGKSRFRSEIA